MRASSFCTFLWMLVFSICPVSSPLAVADESYRQNGSYRFGGEGGWDYLTVDPSARRLYIARSNRVMVIDADSGQLLGDVTGLSGAHGVALAPELGRGFASSGKSGEVLAFDLKSLSVTKRIAAGENPDAVLYDSASRMVLAFNGKSKTMTAIDASNLSVKGTLALGGKPEFAVSDGAGKIFVNLEDQSTILAVDPLQMKILSHYALSPCQDPTGLSMDRASHRLIVGCGNSLAAIVDADQGKVLQTFKAADGIDATAFDRKRNLAFVSDGAGRLTILEEQAGKFKLLQDVATAKGARTLAVDEKTGRVFLPVAQFGATPSPTPGQAGHLRPSVLSGTFEVLVFGPETP